MPSKNEINQLSEILATALDNRPELKQRLSSLLSRTKNTAGRETMKQRKQKAREMFTGMYLKEKLKSAI